MSTFYEQRTERLFIGEMTRFPFPTHVHSLAELIIVTAGSARVGVGDAEYDLSPGDSVVVFPLVPHSYNRLSFDSAGLVAIFPPDTIPEYASTFHGLQPENPMLPAGKAGADLRLAVSRLECLNMTEDLPLCVAYLHVLLAGVLHSLTYRPVYDFSERDLGSQIIRYISEHAYEDITLDTAAHALGISASHLSHFFSERLHINFRRFINAIRVDRARMLMRDPNRTLTEICDACGYANMRTFRRAFQQEIGVLPSEHQQSLRTRVSEE